MKDINLKSEKLVTYFLTFITFLLLACLLLPPVIYANTSDKESTEILTKFGEALSKVAERVKPAVVNISTSRTVRTQRPPFFDDPLFKRFFGDIGPQKRKVTNLGSGVIATSDGYILTNNHVIEGAEDIIVKLSDGKEYKGKPVGMDSRTDIAIIKINETNLPTVPWGDSDKLRVGEMVLAIGNPYGLSQTITMGIISALGRSGIGITDYEDFIQTDAAINPGNSGGALVNIRGELIGINTAIFSVTGGYQGIGFAIPSNMVKNVMDSIFSQGRVVRGWLGVQIQPLTPDIVKQLGLKDETGVLLVDVVEGGPADKGELKRYDVIVEYDGKKIDNPFHFKNMVAATKPGKTVEIKIIRNGNLLTAKVTIGELPIEPQIVSPAQFENSLRGVSVQELTDEVLQKLGITRKIKGVVVNSIEEDSPALGYLSKGDIIMEVNRKPVTNLKEYNDIVSKIEKGKDILLGIMRGGFPQVITVPAR
ncbi:MucD [Dissulfurispira thermophila]|uniref:MucD n=1 Tax=Dissulfurispira thermophila TaxID=2715679 RepID=A0A7G1H1X9_9BACT|nr:DegQ family serine endoprotease [Dissulfurispira thermophila]BCB96163.1 MucD [Dissulfurispira thermophila]